MIMNSSNDDSNDQPVVIIPRSTSTPRPTKSSDDLVKLAQVTSDGDSLLMDQVIKDYVNPDFMDNLYVFGIKLAENGLVNNARILSKLDEILSELLARLSPEVIKDLPDEVITQKVALLFEMQSRYQAMIDRVLSEDRYTYFMENLQALRRVVESKSTNTNASSDIYAKDIDRRVVQELLTDLRSALSTQKSSNELIMDKEGKNE